MGVNLTKYNPFNAKYILEGPKKIQLQKGGNYSFKCNKKAI